VFLNAYFAAFSLIDARIGNESELTNSDLAAHISETERSHCHRRWMELDVVVVGPTVMLFDESFCCQRVVSLASVALVMSVGNAGRLALLMQRLPAPLAPPAQSCNW
jgi:hypothetical protein